MAGKAYRLSWNPSRAEYRDDVSDRDRAAVEANGSVVRSWLCGQARIVEGSRIFLVRLGLEPKGLVGIGVARGDAHDGGVLIEFTDLRPEPPLIPWDILSGKQPFARVSWSNQNPAVIVPSDVVVAIDRWVDGPQAEPRPAGTLPAAALAPSVAPSSVAGPRVPDTARAFVSQDAWFQTLGVSVPLLIQPAESGHDPVSPYLEQVRERLIDPTVTRVSAVSYVAQLAALEEAGVLHPRPKTRILLRPPDGFSRQQAEELLGRQAGSEGSLEVRQLRAGAGTALAHLKVIHIECGGERCALVGSSNLTRKGLTQNIEVNVLVTPKQAGFRELEELLDHLFGDEMSEKLDPGVFVAHPWLIPARRQPLQLLDFQARALNQLRDCYDDVLRQDDDGGAILSLPTGTGKTMVAAHFLLDKVLTEPDSRVLWVAPQVELLAQAADTVAEQRPFARYAGVRIEPSERLRSKTERRPLESEDNILFRVLHTAANHTSAVPGKPLVFDAVVVDEAHWGASDSATLLPRLAQRVSAKFWLGLTATPFRKAPGDGGFLARRFPMRITEPRDIDKLTDARGRSVRARIDAKEVPTGFKIDLAPNELVARELSNKALKRFDDPRRNRKVARTWQPEKHGQTLVFAINTAHANALCRAFEREHPGARLQVMHSGRVDGNALKVVVPPSNRRFGEYERQEVYSRFRRGEIDVLIGVNMYTTGVDFPSVNTLFMSRPTLSPLLYAQMLGRGRRGPAFGGTERVHVVDFADQLATHRELRERLMTAEREERYDEIRRELKQRWNALRDGVRQQLVPDACVELHGRPAIFRISTPKRRRIKLTLRYRQNAGAALAG